MDGLHSWWTSTCFIIHDLTNILFGNQFWYKLPYHNPHNKIIVHYMFSLCILQILHVILHTSFHYALHKEITSPIPSSIIYKCSYKENTKNNNFDQSWLWSTHFFWSLELHSPCFIPIHPPSILFSIPRKHGFDYDHGVSMWSWLKLWLNAHQPYKKAFKHITFMLTHT